MNAYTQLLEPTKEDCKFLLAVPRSDVVVFETKNNNNKSLEEEDRDQVKKQQEHQQQHDYYPKKQKQQPPPTLLLLQLPSSDWTVEDLRHAHIVVEKTTGSSSLIVDSKQASFELHKAETSNAWALIPPQSTTTTTTSPSAPKRAKLLNGSSSSSSLLRRTQVRLLHQGSGASFLELRFKTLRVMDLYRHLLQQQQQQQQQYKNGPQTTTTLANLSRDLQSSQAQIEQGLRSCPALFVPYPTTNDASCNNQGCWGLWDSATLRTVRDALLAALTEVCPTYDQELVSPSQLISYVQERTAVSTHSHWIAQIIRPLYKQSTGRPVAREGEEEETQNTQQGHHHHQEPAEGAVEYVAQCVAHSLFLKRPTPWPEDDFWERWKLELPGTCHEKIHSSYLHGIAVRNDDAHWVYAPVEEFRRCDSLSQAVVQLQAAVPNKTTWTKLEWEPHVQHWSNWFGVTVPYILQQHLSVVVPTTNKNNNKDDSSDGVERYRFRN